TVVKIDGVVVGEGFYWYSSPQNSYPNDNKKHKITMTFKTKSENDFNSVADKSIYIQPNRNEYGQPFVFDVWDIKLEKGNKATDWSPAPEDYDNKINNLSQEVTKNSSALNVLDNKINLKVDSSTVKQMLDDELNVVKSNVQTNQSELKLLSNQISSKVEKSEYTTDINGITQDISNTKSEINQLSDSVNSKITSVEQKFDELEVGGRNLI